MTTSRTFQMRDRFVIVSVASAGFPAHASPTSLIATSRCLSPPFDATPDSRRQPSMNVRPMYSALFPVFSAAKPMTIVNST